MLLSLLLTFGTMTVGRLRRLALACFLSGAAALHARASTAFAQVSPTRPEWEASLLAAREAVWRDYFSLPDSLAAVLTDDFIALDNGGGWRNKQQAVDGSRQAVADGVTLISLSFPRNSIQRYGDVAIIYGEYSYEVARAGQPRVARSGRCTEVFRWNGRRWLHTAWHLDMGR